MATIPVESKHIEAMIRVQKERLQYSKKQMGQPPVRQDRDHVRVLVDGEKILSTPRADQLIVVTLNEPYPPCTKPLKELERIALPELKQETRHRGRFLLVKLTGFYRLGHAANLTAVESDEGDIEAVKFSFCADPRVDLSAKGEMIIIKEPYLTHIEHAKEQQCLRINHPSDFILLRSVYDQDIPASVPSQRGSRIPPLKCKEMGNEVLKNKDLDSDRNQPNLINRLINKLIQYQLNLLFLLA